MKIALIILAAFVAMASSDTPFEEFKEGNIKFTAGVYKDLLKTNTGNFVFSPLSAELILALAQAGAKGRTAEEFTSSIHLPTQNRTREALRDFLPTLRSSQGENLKLLSANKLFLGKNFNILESFKAIATGAFDADADNVDFTDPHKAANVINKWVEERTNNKIRDLVSADKLDTNTRLILVNTLYLKSRWQYQFDPFLTEKSKFYSSSQNSKDVDMMFAESDFKYYECKKKDVQFVELPYVGEKISMTIVVPNQREGLKNIEGDIEAVLKPHPLVYEDVSVRLPRFVVESEVDFNPILQSLGLQEVFTDRADLSGISKEALRIDDVVQKAFINVTEAGTEGAAASRGGLVPLSGPLNPKYVTADHPFVYFIKYNDVILFLGKIANFS